MDEGRFHRERRAAILRERPEVKRLFGHSPRTAWFAAGVVAGQFALAAVVAGQPWWVILIAAYGIGAFATHYLNVVMHECSHNLVLRTTPLNKAFAIFANLPALAPGAITFRHYHLLHHRFLGRRGLDADVAMPWEVRLFGRSPFGKFLWLLAQPLTYTVVHPLQVRHRIPLDRWLVANLVAVAGAGVAVAFACGPGSLLYLALSSYFSLGPHPTGAHVLQEHLIFEGDGETTSYYGPINAISINHGLHLEHHDFPNVPGARLPELLRIAPQHYGGRFHHRSRFATMWQFITDRRIALDTRAIRAEAPARLDA
jgi:sphingolipid 4-desaturase/C4-monooxygenase